MNIKNVLRKIMENPICPLLLLDAALVSLLYVLSLFDFAFTCVVLLMLISITMTLILNELTNGKD